MQVRKINTLLSFFLAPRSKNKDEARREYILNVLLCGSLLLSSIATFASWQETFSRKLWVREESISISIIFLIFLLGYFLSRAGKSKLVAYVFVLLYLFLTIYLSYTWGADTPQGLLTYALIIVMSGILIGSRFAFIITLIITGTIFFLFYTDTYHLLSMNSTWKTKPSVLGDAIVYDATLFIIALISLLFNREMERTLKRARDSEAALKRERDNLEALVENRTRELKQAQAEKMVQLYRFSEFGRMASGLFHDLVNPLGLVSLNLDLLNEKSKTLKPQEVNKLLNRAMIGTQRLETFVQTARKQMKNQEVLQVILLKEETSQALQMLAYKARKAQVSIVFDAEKGMQTFASPIKLSQLVTNLVTNAIDSYDNSSKKNKLIELRLKKARGQALLTVEDWGSGIPQKYIDKIFEPLFTTKSFQNGTGMGLAICRDIIEKDFGGTIRVKSIENKGTKFIITFPLTEAPTGIVKKEKKL